MRWFVATATTVTLLVVLLSCGRTSNSGGSLIPPTAPTPGSGVVTPLSIRISGPSTIAPGVLMQFSATARYSDGSSKDVTTTVMWHSSDTSVFTINNAGVATGRQSGEAIVTAALASGSGTLTATQTIAVLPPGTFRLDGYVRWLGRAVAEATVQVTAGTGTSLETTTSPTGAYRLYGVAGDIEVTVTKASYAPIEKTVRIDGNTSVDFDMVTTNPPPELAGTYTLQITADAACATGPQPLPNAARVRRYTATIVDETNGLQIPLSDANFLPHANFLWGYVTPDGAYLDVNNLDYYGYASFPPPDLGEILPDGTVYCPSGSIAVATVGENLVGTLNGAIRVRLANGQLFAQCTSTHHNLTFTRQSGNQARVRVRR